MRRPDNKYKGFTLAELLMAVWVMSIILTAVAAMAFALGSANDSADDTAEIQSRIRYTTVYLGELVRRSKMICRNASGNVVLWRADDNGDRLINPGEIVSLEIDSGNGGINLITYQPNAAQAGASMTPALIKTGVYKQWMISRGIPSTSITLIDNCNYVFFTTDILPPFAKKLNIFFGLAQGGIDRDFQITAMLRCSSDCMLKKDGMSFVTDDDI
jgi:prepilin-type N-terminal cleavage/methylation domain-containing protein